MAKELLEKASKNVDTLNELKRLSVRLMDFELASKCRELELELYPVTDKETIAWERAKKLNLAFRMVELNISEDTCHKIEQTLNLYQQMDGDFSLDDATKIMVENGELFKRFKHGNNDR